MNDWQRLGITLGVLVVATFALIGVLSVTRGTPVQRVVALNMGRAGPPSVTDSLFARCSSLAARRSSLVARRAAAMRHSG